MLKTLTHLNFLQLVDLNLLLFTYFINIIKNLYSVISFFHHIPLTLSPLKDESP